MLVVGLMAGTSLDAIDAALVELAPAGEPGALRMAVRAFAMAPFDEALRERVRALLPPAQGSTAEVCAVSFLLGEAFAARCHGPEILLCVEGEAITAADSDAGGQALELARGASAFVPGSARGYTLRGAGTLYRASVGS